MDALSDALLVGGESGDDVEVVMAFIDVPVAWETCFM